MNKLELFEDKFNEILDINSIRNFLLSSKRRRIDFYKIYNIIPQNIINKYNKFFYNYRDLNSWNSIILFLSLYSKNKSYINSDELELIIYDINKYFFKKEDYFNILSEFQQFLDVEKEIHHNYFLLIMAVLKQNKDDEEFVTSFLDGIINEEQIKEYLNGS